MTCAEFLAPTCRGGLVLAAGTVTGLALWSVAAAFGLSALLAASRVGYDAVRIAGGLYLSWLGVQSLRSHGTVPAAANGGCADADAPRVPQWSVVEPAQTRRSASSS